MDQVWRKSRFSTEANCVEARRAPGGGVELRDSQGPEGTVLHVGEVAWAEFLRGMAAGEFDLPGSGRAPEPGG